jgi:hypothetical protein
MNNPLRHVGQTARPEPSTTDEQPGQAGTAEKKPAAPEASSAQRPATKKIPDLKPGEPPPESSAGS